MTVLAPLLSETDVARDMQSTTDLVPPSVAARFIGLELANHADRVEFWRRVHDWRIPYFRLGPRTIRFSERELTAWISSRRVPRPRD